MRLKKRSTLALSLAIRAWRNDDLRASGSNLIDKGIVIVALVRDDGRGAQVLNRFCGTQDVGNRSVGDDQAQRATCRVHRQLQLGVQSARILVHDSLYRKFMAAFETAVRALVVAPPLSPDATMGPLISRSHHMRVQALVECGLTAGARVAFCGQMADEADQGFFMAPVVVAEPAADNVLWTDEIFGPVACVKSFRTDDDASRSRTTRATASSPRS